MCWCAIFADTATKLRTPRKINGIEFDGTKDIGFAVIPIGGIFPVATCWGAPLPDSSGKYKYIELTDLPKDSYNDGLVKHLVTQLTPHSSGDTAWLPFPKAR